SRAFCKTCLPVASAKLCDHLPQRALDRGANIPTLQGKRQVGEDEAVLGATVEGLALEVIGGELLALGKRQHAVGELDLVAGAALLRFQDAEDFRLQDVTAVDVEIGGRGPL